MSVAPPAYPGLQVGSVRRFEWYLDEHDHPIGTPRTLVGTVDAIEAERVVLWVSERGFGAANGWWAHLKNEDAEKHALRPTNLKREFKNC